MTKIFNVIRENTMASWTVAVVTGFLYYFGYSIGRAIIRPLVKRIMLGFPEFFLDPLTGPIVGREALLNIFESAIVAIPVGIILSILLCTTFQKKATIYGIASILIFVLMFAILISLRLSSENDPLWWIRIIKPISAAIVFGVILWLMTKTKFSLTIGSTGSPKNPAPGEPERWTE
jgi:uncharacterized membrane protein